MDATVFLKGLIIGLIVSLPVGPISVVGIRRILLKGPFHGFMTGLGAATADGIYCIIAAFGLKFLADFLLNYSFHFNLIGGLFLLVFGIRVLLSQAKIPINLKEENGKETGIKRSFIYAFFLAFTNPVMILSFLAIFAAFGIEAISQSVSNVILLVAGVFTGALGFWLIFSQFVNSIRTRITLDTFSIINKVSGGILLFFGILVFINAFTGSF